MLGTEPDNEHAFALLAVVLTDRHDPSFGMSRARGKEILRRLPPHERAYYAGVLPERQAKEHLERTKP